MVVVVVFVVFCLIIIIQYNQYFNEIDVTAQRPTNKRVCESKQYILLLYMYICCKVHLSEEV